MFKKVICIIIAINIIFLNINYSIADDEDEQVLEEDLVEVVNQITEEPKLNARIAVAYDRNSRRGNMGKR